MSNTTLIVFCFISVVCVGACVHAHMCLCILVMCKELQLYSLVMLVDQVKSLTYMHFLAGYSIDTC